MHQLMMTPAHSTLEPGTYVFFGFSSPTRITGSSTKIRPARALGSKSKRDMPELISAAFLDENGFVSRFENSSPSKPMTPCKKPAVATSLGNACATKSRLAFSCVKPQTVRIPQLARPNLCQKRNRTCRSQKTFAL